MKLLKYTNIYVFIVVLSLVGFIAGYSYYHFQSDELKSDIRENYNLEDNLNRRVNNIGKRVIEHSKKFIYSIFVIPSIVNVFNIFYEPFQCGFLFNIFNDNLLFSFLFVSLYYFIPLIFSLILIKVGFTLSKRIILLIVNHKDRYARSNCKKIILKYLIIFIISLIYEIIIFMVSRGVNSYLIQLL